jgi:predicted ATPase
VTVTHIELENWKNFRTVNIDLSGRMFLVGPNASGKSNLLDVFRFMRDIAKPGGGLQKAVEERGGLSRIRCLAARGKSDVSIVLRFEDNGDIWTYSLSMTQESQSLKRPLVKGESVKKNEIFLFERPDEEDKVDPERETQTFLEQINMNKDFRNLVRYLEKVQYLHLVPQLLKFPMAFAGADLTEDPFGKGFLEKISMVGKKRREQLLRIIEEALRIAVPQLSNLEYTEESGKPHLEVRYKHWRPAGAKQREDQLSDGTLRLIGLFWALLESDGLLLLEEPELSLNGAIIKKLPEMIHRNQRKKGRQIFLTTHSNDLLLDTSIPLSRFFFVRPTLKERKSVRLGIRRDPSPLRRGINGRRSIIQLTQRRIEQLELDMI